MTRILIIGGSDAGISAALAAREQDPLAGVTLITADTYPNFSVCGMPFYLGGEVKDWRHLAHRTREEITAAGITLELGTRAVAINPDARTVRVEDPDGSARMLNYDRLVVATGAEPVRPPVPGLEEAAAFVLHDIADGLKLEAFLRERRPKTALVLGAGFIGLEMAEALTRRGLQVTMVEQAPAVMPGLDPDLAESLTATLRSRGVEVLTGRRLVEIATADGQAVALTDKNERIPVDLVLVAAGVRPQSRLVAEAGARTGIRGALSVDARMATSLPDVYAAGDCVETFHRLLGRPAYLPLGTTAHKQGRVAGANAAGGQLRYPGSLGTQVLQLFDRVAARTGLTPDQARAGGLEPLTATITVPDHKAYFPGAEDLTIRILGDRSSGRLLGAAILGGRQGAVAQRLDILAAALSHQADVAGLLDLDLAYTPPLSSPWDPVQMAAQAWLARARD